MNRFDIYTVQGEEYLTKPRPCVLVQNVPGGAVEVIPVIPFTSAEPTEANAKFRIKVLPSKENGLSKISYLMVDRTVPVEPDSLGYKVGYLDLKYREMLMVLLAELYGVQP
jgi:mRNA-degrading endonuclease toxin of MazEF toxin-antitoxin module